MNQKGDDIDDIDDIDNADTIGDVSEPNAKSNAADLIEGTRIDRYLILGLIGKGGMGAVYKAYDPELDRRIAIKIMTLTPVQDETASLPQARLMREAQALAKLNHPNVVSVFDVGTYQDSVYIAMEFVEGKTLRVWLKETNPSRQEIVEVFLKAGRGLQNAHQKGIIHRDFKPENLLVGERGQVKVLDFGLARAAQGNGVFTPDDDVLLSSGENSSSEKLLSAPITQIGVSIGTPVYMAPEHFLQQELDEKTDQFSFCVTLFEALYGRRPFTAKTFAELSKNITLGAVRIPPDATLPDWLKKILLKGLSVSKTDRYSSVAELLSELAKDPVVERAAKRKKRMLVLLIVVIAMLPFGVWYLIFKGGEICSGAEKKLAGVWNQQKRESVRQSFANTQLSFASDTFVRIDQRLTDYFNTWGKEYTEACEATRLRDEQPEDIMVLRMACLNRHLKSATALTDLFTKADKKMVLKAVMAVASLAGFSVCRDPETLQSKIHLPENEKKKKQVDQVRDTLIQVKALKMAGKIEEGRTLCEQAVAQAQKTSYTPVVAEAMFWLGGLQEQTALYEQARNTLLDTAYLAEQSRLDRIKAEALVDLLWVVGDRLYLFEEALRTDRWAEAAVLRLDERGVLESTRLNNLGILYDNKGDYAKALHYYRQSYQILEKTLEPNHPSLAKSLNNLGYVYFNQGESEKAFECLRKALEKKMAALGLQHPSIAVSLNNIGEVLWSQDDYPQALEYHQKALVIWKKALGATHPLVATSLFNHGEVFRSQGAYKQALEYYQQSLRMRQKALGSNNPEVAQSLCSLGSVFLAKGDYEQAWSMFNKAYTIWEKSLGPTHQNVSWALSGMGWIQLQRGLIQSAISYFENVLMICNHGKCKLNRANVLSSTYVGLALALWKAGKDHNRALALAKKGRQLLKSSHSVHAKKMLAKVEEFLTKHDK